MKAFCAALALLTVAPLIVHAEPAGTEVAPAVKAVQVQVPEDFRAVAFMAGLNYPTSVEFDGQGLVFVAEAGYAPGDQSARPRIIVASAAGEMLEQITEGLEAPINDLLWHNQRLYISHKGRISVLDSGKVRDLVTGLPSLGDHQNNQMAMGPDGKLYFGQGTATNSGIVGADNHKMGWLQKHPEVHDVPPTDIQIKTESYASGLEGQEQARTAAFQPFSKAPPATDQSATVTGNVKANGTILRMNPDGTGLEVYASGLRNPYGLVWTPDKKLYATENGFDDRGSRPIANDKEDIYLIKQGAFYGWPDFASGIPVTDARFKPEGKEQPQFLLVDHPAVEKPQWTFPKHSAITKLDVAPEGSFGFQGNLFIAFFGHMAPLTGTVDGAQAAPQVVRLVPTTGEQKVFFSYKAPGETQASDNSHRGRLVDVRFTPAGDALFVADFGVMTVDEKGPHAVPQSGVIWRVVPKVTGTPRPVKGRTLPDDEERSRLPNQQ
ncbi:MAG: PQQ-dependent sugar dehydrogenase [Prosthecobacter sp.]|nr:PQQ-dependent sugar dehydrogenase [Prosthecobacter sp.]